MCGIVGFHGSGNFADLKGMTDALVHRGPDAEGFHTDTENRVFLGHRRLSVLDIEGGAQPMWSSDRHLCIIFNGEIYNNIELRNELICKGHHFTSHHSDTETLLYGYREWGANLLNRINGMFAFAIWDMKKRQLFLARDRFGEKPLYWTNNGSIFAFGSEIKAFEQHRSIANKISPMAIKKLFAFGFIPSPYSIYQGIEKIPAGCYLTYDLDTHHHRILSYWQYSINPSQKKINVSDAANELLCKLKTAVKRRLVADVPIGVFLSGGIDSSTIAALACNIHSQSQLKTFCIGFSQPSYDESSYAEEVAHFLSTDHYVNKFDIDDLLALSPEVFQRLDEPFGDPSLLPTFALSKLAKKHVTVALSGDGGDELLAGYDTFSALKTARIFEKLIPELGRKALIHLTDLMPKSNKNMSLDYKLNRAIQGVGRGPAVWHPQWLAPASIEMIQDLMNEPTSIEELYGDAIHHWNSAKSDNLVDKSSEYYVKFYLQDNILVKTDRAAMMNSLETRTVFLDNDVVDFLTTLSGNYKFRNGIKKAILKDAVSTILPKRILNRKKKGFGIPLADWVRSLPLDANTLNQLKFDPVIAKHWEKQHLLREKDYRLFLWNCYTLQQWLKI